MFWCVVFGVDMLEGFGMIKFFLGILKDSGELGKINSKTDQLLWFYVGSKTPKRQNTQIRDIIWP